MPARNPNLAKLPGGYLFPEINRRKQKLLSEHPEARLISLGIGNTTQPLTPHICDALSAYAAGLGTPEGYSGYGDEQGLYALREKIAAVWYQGRVQPEDVFVADGAKCDIARLQWLFGPNIRFAVQDPAYPVYIDGGVIAGQTGALEGKRYQGVAYMPCTPQNGFFPDLESLPAVDIIYFCSPNNPTGAAASRSQLERLVAFAKRRGAIIIFDAAYALFIRDPDLPRSIYEIPGAEEAAIEVNSFSKSAGFTGVRLGWTVVPRSLRYAGGESVHVDWNRISTTLFNGASNIAQAGGLAALDPTGRSEMESLVEYYMQNARVIKAALSEAGIESWGGENAPYLWALFPGLNSWEAFELLLQRAPDYPVVR